MVGETLFKDIWKIDSWKKALISIIVFFFSGILIYSLTEFLDSGYPLFLLFVPLIVTSGFYVKRWNLSPSIFSSLSLLILSILHYRQEFFDLWYISFLNLTIFFIIFSVVSILIGHVNVSFKTLMDKKEFEIKNRKRAERENNILNTLLRQDLQIKFQIIQGYLQLLDDFELSEKQENYLQKALEKGEETGDILRMVKKLEEIEGNKSIERELFYILEDVVEHVSDLAEKENVLIEKEYCKGIGKIRKYYQLRTLFLKILETQIKLSDCDKIKISCEQKVRDFVLKIEDDGKRLSDDVSSLFSGKTYEGKTAGEGGLRYYIIKEIAEQGDAKIEILNSELGGNKFKIHLPKAKK